MAARNDPYTNKNSLEFGMRQRRFAAVQALIAAAIAEHGFCHILDLGGTETYWLIGRDFLEKNRGRLHVTIVNTEEQAVLDPGMFTFVKGSATDRGLFMGRVFDVVHSNSVIEHVGSWQDMQAFAGNVRRLGRRYYVQTPNYWFAYEPHFRFPGFQYLPAWMRVELIRHFALGFFPRIPDRDEARKVISEHCLISTRQMAKLFPDARIRHETFYGLNKSILAVGNPMGVPA